MAFPTLKGVHLLPSTGEFVYDPSAVVYGFRTTPTGGFANGTNLNTLANPGGGVPDYVAAINNLATQHPECATVSLVIAWFFDSTDASNCHIYPSTNFCANLLSPTPGEFLQLTAGPEAPPPTGTWTQIHWMCSSLTEQNSGLIPLPTIPGTNGQSFIYGGTPSDPSVVRCIQDLKKRGYNVIFYPFLLSTASGEPWRGEITFSPDLSAAATAAVSTFMGSATVGHFTQNPGSLTVSYSNTSLPNNGLYDWTYRRMILHYANLCCVAGGVNLFVIGSELRGLETLRGPGWTPAGTTDGSGYAVWDNPFVYALKTLAADVRSTFDSSGLTRNLAGLEHLIAYSADWSTFMGWQYSAGGYTGGQWPHLDALFADPNIDFASMDNYLPLTDWTTGNGGFDALYWSTPAYAGVWPPPNTGSNLYGLGMSGPPTIYSLPYIKAGIEGGQYFDWYYNSGGSGAHGGLGFDPNGSGLIVTLPTGDRELQARNAYSANQQMLANKQVRWWWNNTHQAIYDAGDGHGWAPHGPQTEWIPNSKSILFLEYGVPCVDKGPNQPNVFFASYTTESATPFWSIWDPAQGGLTVPATGMSYLPRRDDTIAGMAVEAIYEYWNTDNGGLNNPSVAGVPMLMWPFCCVWNWDARPFPTFPAQAMNWDIPVSGVPGQTVIQGWGDTANWATGDCATGGNVGGRMYLPPPPPSAPPGPGSYPSFPGLSALGWSVHVKPKFSTLIAQHVSGRETRGQRYANPYFDIELTYDDLRSDPLHLELQTIAGFLEEMSGKDDPFWIAPPGLSGVAGQALGTGDGMTTVFPLVASIGGYVGSVYGTSGVSAIYFNGVAQGSGWSLSSGYLPAITFASAPASDVAISADFGLLWLCRFADDVQDLEEVMAQLFELKTLRLTTVRP